MSSIRCCPLFYENHCYFTTTDEWKYFQHLGQVHSLRAQDLTDKYKSISLESFIEDYLHPRLVDGIDTKLRVVQDHEHILSLIERNKLLLRLCKTNLYVLIFSIVQFSERKIDITDILKFKIGDTIKRTNFSEESVIQIIKAICLEGSNAFNASKVKIVRDLEFNTDFILPVDALWKFEDANHRFSYVLERFSKYYSDNNRFNKGSIKIWNSLFLPVSLLLQKKDASEDQVPDKENNENSIKPGKKNTVTPIERKHVGSAWAELYGIDAFCCSSTEKSQEPKSEITVVKSNSSKSIPSLSLFEPGKVKYYRKFDHVFNRNELIKNQLICKEYFQDSFLTNVFPQLKKQDQVRLPLITNTASNSETVFFDSIFVWLCLYAIDCIIVSLDYSLKSSKKFNLSTADISLVSSLNPGSVPQEAIFYFVTTYIRTIIDDKKLAGLGYNIDSILRCLVKGYNLNEQDRQVYEKLNSKYIESFEKDFKNK